MSPGSRTALVTASLLALLTASPLALGAPLGEPFIVQSQNGNIVFLRNDRGSVYMITTFSCPLYKNDRVYIDSTYAGRPRLNADMVKYDTKKEEHCPVNDIREITSYATLLLVREKENVATISYRSVEYEIEYGYGCLDSLWNEVSKKIFVELDGKLDGIGDNIVLSNGDWCEIWGAKVIGRSEGGSGVLPCPAHAHDNPKDPKTCVCDAGFDLNEAGTACIATEKCPAGSSGTWGSCVCARGSVWSTDACVSYSQACKDRYGKYALGDKYGCYCSAGSVMNYRKTTCVLTTTNAAKKCGLGKEWVGGVCKAKRER
jgi:hypothetical protein